MVLLPLFLVARCRVHAAAVIIEQERYSPQLSVCLLTQIVTSASR